MINQIKHYIADLKHYYSTPETITDDHEEFNYDSKDYPLLLWVATMFSHRNCGSCRMVMGFLLLASPTLVWLGAFGFRVALMLFVVTAFGMYLLRKYLESDE